MQTWLLASLCAEDTWRHDRKSITHLQGITIDTEKFLDAITFEHAAEALHSINFPSPAISIWIFAVRNIHRHAAVNGAISPDGFRPGRGIPQGDPLSMLVAAAALGQWATRIPTQLKVNHVFVDDRLFMTLLISCRKFLISQKIGTETTISIPDLKPWHLEPTRHSEMSLGSVANRLREFKVI